MAVIIIAYLVVSSSNSKTGSYRLCIPRWDMKLLGSTGSVSMLSSAQKQHKLPTSRAHRVNCGAPTYWQVTGLFGCPPNVRSLHMTWSGQSTDGCLLYVYVGSFRSSSLYVTTSYYFPVTHSPVCFISCKSSWKSFFFFLSWHTRIETQNM